MRRAGCLLCLIGLFAWPALAHAVIVYGGDDGTQNTKAPSNGAPWNRVGIVNGCTGVYLGSVGGADWVLTAAHVGSGSFTINGSTYSAVAGSSVQLTTLGSYKADLLLYRIASPLDWSLLPLASSQLTIDAPVTMIGNGRNRAETPTTGYVGTVGKKQTWFGTTLVVGATEAQCYDWASGNALRWGTNTVSGNAYVANSTEPGAWVTDCSYTTFDAQDDEAQGAEGDSGGGVFSKDGSGAWSLVGIMAYIDTYAGQPGSTAVTGNKTYFADLSAYRRQILTTIPEPATVPVLLGLATLGYVVVRRLRRRR